MRFDCGRRPSRNERRPSKSGELRRRVRRRAAIGRGRLPSPNTRQRVRGDARGDEAHRQCRHRRLAVQHDVRKGSHEAVEEERDRDGATARPVRGAERLRGATHSMVALLVACRGSIAGRKSGSETLISSLRSGGRRRTLVTKPLKQRDDSHQDHEDGENEKEKPEDIADSAGIVFLAALTRHGDVCKNEGNNGLPREGSQRPATS